MLQSKRIKQCHVMFTMYLWNTCGHAWIPYTALVLPIRGRQTASLDLCGDIR